MMRLRGHRTFLALFPGSASIPLEMKQIPFIKRDSLVRALDHGLRAVHSTLCAHVRRSEWSSVLVLAIQFGESEVKDMCITV